MLCPSCGAEVGDQIQLCGTCSAARANFGVAEDTRASAQQSSDGLDSQASDEAGRVFGFDNAGFWMRFCSSAFDGAVIQFFTTIILIFVALSLDRVLAPVIENLFGNRSSVMFVGSAILVAAVSSILIVVLLSLLYYPVFESSPLQATPGKLILGMKVTRSDGSRVSFGRAVAHHFLRMVSMVFLAVGHFTMIFNAQKQTLYDEAIDVVVVRTERVNAFTAFGVFVAAVVISYINGLISAKTESSDSLKSLRIKSEMQQQGSRTFPANNDRTFSGAIGGAGAAASSTSPQSQPLQNAPANSTPAPVTTPEIMEPIPAAPFGEILADKLRVPIRSTLAFYYPEVGELAIGFFTEAVDGPLREELRKRRNVTTSVNGRRADFVLYLRFSPNESSASLQSLRGYTAYFYQNPNSQFSFPGGLGAVSFSKSTQQLSSGSIEKLSGSLRQGSKIELKMGESGSAKTNPTKFAWRTNYVLELE